MDALNKMFQEWQSKNPDGDVFQAFQGGVTAGAVSMRKRAMGILQEWKKVPGVNEVINEVGSLADLPKE